MTEQQIGKLKALLESSNEVENSPELDEKILKRSKRPTQVTDYTVWGRTYSWVLGNTATAFSALMLTAIMMFGLAEMISVTAPEAPIAETPNQFQVPTDTEQDDSKQNRSYAGYVEPTKRPEKFAGSSNFDDDLLSDITLPSTQQLLDNMRLPMSQDRLNAEQTITHALAEINHLLKDGNLRNARLRYQKLREGCQPCKLPQTLEALAHQTSSADMDSG